MAAPAEPLFVPEPNNDASPSLRGFFYQVALSVKMMLMLQAGQCIINEYGEDIDLVSDGLAKGTPAEWLIRQIKHKTEKLTICSKQFVKTFCHAIAHVYRNPGLFEAFVCGRLQFQLVTTSEPQGILRLWTSKDAPDKPVHLRALQNALLPALSGSVASKELNHALLCLAKMELKRDDPSFIFLWEARFHLVCEHQMTKDDSMAAIAACNNDIETLLRDTHGFAPESVCNVRHVLVSKAFASTCGKDKGSRTWTAASVKRLLSQLKEDTFVLNQHERAIFANIRSRRDYLATADGEEVMANPTFDRELYDALRKGPCQGKAAVESQVRFFDEHNSSFETEERRQTVVNILMNPNPNAR